MTRSTATSDRLQKFDYARAMGVPDPAGHFGKVDHDRRADRRPRMIAAGRITDHSRKPPVSNRQRRQNARATVRGAGNSPDNEQATSAPPLARES